MWSPRHSAPKNLHEAILDLMSPPKGHVTAACGKLASFSSGDVDLLQ
jgi:hypothetical protein